MARAAANAIAWNTLLPKGKIQVWVDHGRVTSRAPWIGSTNANPRTNASAIWRE